VSGLRRLLGAAIPVPELPARQTAALVELDGVLDGVAELAPEHDFIGRYPTRSVELLKDSGILALSVPAEFGGVGAGHRASLEAQLRIGMADSAVAQLFKIHDELVREIFVYCPPELAGPLATRIVEDRHVLGLAVAEAGPRVDTPWTTTSIPNDIGWQIDGVKIYTTGAAEADEIATWTFDPTAPGIDTNPLLGARLFLVPRGSPGVTVHRDWDAMGQRATDSGTVGFEAVQAAEVWLANVAGAAPLPDSSLRYQAGFAAVSVGIGLAALAAAAPFVGDCSRPWPSAGVDRASDDPMVRRTAGRLVADLVAAYHATMATASLLDGFRSGSVARIDVAIPVYAAKAAATRAMLDATTEMFSLMGTRSVARVNGFDRYWRNARTLSLHDPNEWKHVELGRHVLSGWDPEPGIYQ